MFSMHPFWQRFFYLLTYISQGASFLNPQAYSVLHNNHHLHSDTEKDPHSPVHNSNVFSLMKKTYFIYEDILNNSNKYTDDSCPKWNFIDRLGRSHYNTGIWIIIYPHIYAALSPEWYWYLCLPIHYFMGPIQGAIVNWCGHKYGYRNYKLEDKSKNFFAWDVLLMGELFQNNHHQNASRVNFAHKWFEIDPTYPITLILNYLGIIKIRRMIS